MSDTNTERKPLLITAALVFLSAFADELVGLLFSGTVDPVYTTSIALFVVGIPVGYWTANIAHSAVTIGEDFGHAIERPRFNTKWRYSIYLVPLAALALVYVYFHEPPPDPNTKKILVANIEGPDETFGLTNAILDSLYHIERNYSHIDVEALDEAITQQEGSEVARKIGKEMDADLVLWGWYRAPSDSAQYSAKLEVMGMEGRNNYQSIGGLYSVRGPRRFQVPIATEASLVVSLTIGLITYLAENYDHAIDLLTKVLQSSPDERYSNYFEHAAFGRGMSFYKKGNFRKAIDNFTAWIKREPRPLAYYNRGTIYYEMGEVDSALVDYSEAIQMDTTDVAALNNRGNIYASRGAYENAISDYDAAIKVAPDVPHLRYGRGVAYARSGNLEAAMQDFNDTIEMDSSFARAYDSRGNIYQEMGEFTDAIHNHTTAIEKGLTNAKVFYNRGTGYARMADVRVTTTREKAALLDSALVNLTRAIEIDSSFAPAYDNRSRVHKRLGNSGHASQDSIRASKLYAQGQDS
jgi:tetratricopeptide (TPR) repeat protein